MYCISITEEAAVDEKKGKLYKPKSRILEAKSFLPLDTPPQFLTIDKRNVSHLFSFDLLYKNKNKKSYFVLFTCSFSIILPRHRRRGIKKRRKATLNSSKKN